MLHVVEKYAVGAIGCWPLRACTEKKFVKVDLKPLHHFLSGSVPQAAAESGSVT